MDANEGKSESGRIYKIVMGARLCEPRPKVKELDLEHANMKPRPTWDRILAVLEDRRRVGG